MYGDDYDYAHSRLVDTIVRLKGEPVFVHKVSKGMIATVHRLDDEEVFNCAAGELDLHPVPLGYCNFNKHACYISRVPMRRDWRQGLRRGNFISQGAVNADRRPFDAIRKTILDEFPKFTDALKIIKKIKSVAWHRHWAMDAHGQLLHKGGERPVGIVEDGIPVLTSRYMYLTEALKESL
jgi:hypothetical protein